jgi:multisubunit Na+/H+ antiporter MnhG subunit
VFIDFTLLGFWGFIITATALSKWVYFEIIIDFIFVLKPFALKVLGHASYFKETVGHQDQTILSIRKLFYYAL